eukprot:Amastigsp_a519393_4.p4 type:complete len:122 gc:universal Amastigsp_a519393_4:536-171(-)
MVLVSARQMMVLLLVALPLTLLSGLMKRRQRTLWSLRATTTCCRGWFLPRAPTWEVMRTRRPWQLRTSALQRCGRRRRCASVLIRASFASLRSLTRVRCCRARPAGWRRIWLVFARPRGWI